MKGLRQIIRVSWTARKNNGIGSGKNWSKKNFVSKCKDKEIALLFWSHHETII